MKTKQELVTACTLIAQSGNELTSEDEKLFSELANNVLMVEHPDNCKCQFCDDGERHKIAIQRRRENEEKEKKRILTVNFKAEI